MGRMILVEGLDLAGKSTLIAGLERHYREEGLEVRLANGQFCPNNPSAQVARELVRWDEGFAGLEAGVLFLSSMLWDSRHYLPPNPWQLHLQDSCWLRTLAFEQLYGSQHLAGLMEEQGRQFPRFTGGAIFLTASIQERQRRLRSRAHNDLHDMMAFRKPDKFLAIEARLAQLVVEWESGVVMETDGLSEAAVLAQALEILTPSRDLAPAALVSR